MRYNVGTGVLMHRLFGKDTEYAEDRPYSDNSV